MSRGDKNQTAQIKNGTPERFKPGSPHELKMAEFSLDAPSAKSVQLAAEFTDWEKSPLEMTRADNGIWRISVPLACGNYSYRFLVDGEWRDDPRCAYHIPNPFGTSDATIKVS